MNAEEWRQVDRIFHEALDLEPGLRVRFIEEACSGDLSLRREVEALIAAHAKAGSFLESGVVTPGAALRASIATGTRLGPYEILSAIGAGGMGEVYKAHDTRLQRDVAVKVLRSVVSSDAAAWERFQREARAASALSHPNICMVHDVGEADGQPYLVMELLEGVTLSDRIGGQPLETSAALAIALQIAEAIEAAHLKGIVHRDLKPANVMITGRGRVKVLDFGLARQTAVGGNTEAPTLNSVTIEGTVTGTPPYLSPEVLQGARADVRSDLWAFGVMFYQMLTGRLPFTGPTVYEIGSAILKDRPPPLPATVPLALQAIVERCLMKRSEDRYQSAGEVRAALEASQTLPAEPGGISRRKWLKTAGAAAVLLLAGASALWRLRQKEWVNPLADVKWEPLNSFEGHSVTAAISPNGKLAVFVRDGDVWVQEIGGNDPEHNITKGKYPRLLTGPSALRGVGFSGDARVWFLQKVDVVQNVERAYRASALGGEDPIEYVDGGLSLASSPTDGRLVFHTDAPGDPIYIADSEGDNKKRLYTGEEKGVHCHFPIWSPDGRYIYFVKGIAAIDEMDIFRIRVPEGTITAVASAERITHHNTRITHPDWLDSNLLVYSATAENSSGQWLYAMDLEDRESHRESHRVSSGIGQYLSVAVSANSAMPRRLIATVGEPTAELLKLPTGKSNQTKEDVTSLGVPGMRNLAPRYAAAGDLLFISSGVVGDGLWKLEPGAPDPKELYSGNKGGVVTPAAISHDGSRICFSYRKQGRSGLYVMDAADGGNGLDLAPTLDVRGAASWDRDGKWVAVGANDGKGTRVFNVPVEGGEPVPLVEELSYDPLWSPDFAFILYSEPVGGNQTRLKAVTANKERYTLPHVIMLTGVPVAYRFVPDRKNALVALESGQRFVWVDLASQNFRVIAELGSRFGVRNFDVSPDGEQIVFDSLKDNAQIHWADLTAQSTSPTSTSEVDGTYQQ